MLGSHSGSKVRGSRISSPICIVPDGFLNVAIDRYCQKWKGEEIDACKSFLPVLILKSAGKIKVTRSHMCFFKNAQHSFPSLASQQISYNTARPYGMSQPLLRSRELRMAWEASVSILAGPQWRGWVATLTIGRVGLPGLSELPLAPSRFPYMSWCWSTHAGVTLSMAPWVLPKSWRNYRAALPPGLWSVWYEREPCDTGIYVCPSRAWCLTAIYITLPLSLSQNQLVWVDEEQ